MQKSSHKKGPKILGPFLFFWIFAASLAYCADAAEYERQAYEAAEKNQWQDAISFEQKAYNQDPANPIYKKQLASYYNNYALYLFGIDRYDLAMVNFKEALRLDPPNTTFKENIYKITLSEADKSLKKARFQEAINLAGDCINMYPDKSIAYAFLGSIYYQQNDLEKAVQNWEKAFILKADTPGLKTILDKAKKELSAEKGFKTRARAYFDIKFEGERDSDLVWDVMDMLEDARYKLKSDYGFFTDEKISVIIYNTEQFKQATGKLDWAFGVYDGKIRLKMADVLTDKEFAKKVIYHEYAHAILHILYPKNIPLWLHEGFAQAAEPPYTLSQKEKNLLKETFKTREFSLSETDKLLSSSDQEQVNAGYLASKLFLKYLLDKYGAYKFKNLLEKLNSKAPQEEAMFDIYRLHVKDIESDFAKRFLY